MKNDSPIIIKPLDWFRPAPYNPRKDLKPGDPDYEALKNSIKKWGHVQLLVANKNGTLIGGHQTLKVLKDLGRTEASCTILDLPEREEKALNIALNKIGGDWDIGKVKELLLELDAGDMDLLDTGYSESELKDLIDWTPGGIVEDEDKVPEPPKVAVTKRGDVVVLGDHRLMCGDAGVVADVQCLMDGEKAVLMATDPPYGIAYVELKEADERWDRIKNDELEDSKLQAFLETVFKAADQNALADKAAWYIWHAYMTQGFFSAAAAAAADILLHRQIIWVKPSLILTRSGMYHWRHEPCYYGWKRGHKPPWYGEKNQTSVWEIGRDGDAVHPTQKPVALWEPPIMNHTKPGEVIYEPFAGSGSQLICAEKMGRRCFAMELSEVYCDVIIARWETFTGRKANRLKAAEA